MSNFSKLWFLNEEPKKDPDPDTAPEEEEEEESEDLVWGPGDLQFYGPETRTIPLIGDINERTATVFISQILGLVAKDPISPISVHLNTPGGSLSDGFAIYDSIIAIPNPVIVTAIGQCASAGLLILSAADIKLSFKNTIFFYHPLQSYQTVTGSEEQADSVHEMYKMSLKRYNDCIKDGFGMKVATWRKHFEDVTSKYFYSEEAREFGIIDEIVEPMRHEGKANGKSRKGRPNKR